jgi:hypothetical protein
MGDEGLGFGDKGSPGASEDGGWPFSARSRAMLCLFNREGSVLVQHRQQVPDFKGMECCPFVWRGFPRCGVVCLLGIGVLVVGPRDTHSKGSLVPAWLIGR